MGPSWVHRARCRQLWPTWPTVAKWIDLLNALRAMALILTLQRLKSSYLPAAG